VSCIANVCNSLLPSRQGPGTAASQGPRVIWRGSSKLIGSCGFYKWVKEEARSAEIGYDLNPAYWGKGIMAESLETMIRFGFERMSLNRIRVLIPSHNDPSMRLVQRLGFKKEGVLRDRAYFQGRYVDDVCFSLLRREWSSR